MEFIVGRLYLTSSLGPALLHAICNVLSTTCLSKQTKKKHWHKNHNVSRTSSCIKCLTQSIDRGERGRMVRGWPQVAE